MLLRCIVLLLFLVAVPAMGQQGQPVLPLHQRPYSQLSVADCQQLAEYLSTRDVVPAVRSRAQQPLARLTPLFPNYTPQITVSSQGASAAGGDDSTFVVTSNLRVTSNWQEQSIPLLFLAAKGFFPEAERQALGWLGYETTVSFRAEFRREGNEWRLSSVEGPRWTTESPRNVIEEVSTFPAAEVERLLDLEMARALEPHLATPALKVYIEALSRIMGHLEYLIAQERDFRNRQVQAENAAARHATEAARLAAEEEPDGFAIGQQMAMADKKLAEAAMLREEARKMALRQPPFIRKRDLLCGVAATYAVARGYPYLAKDCLVIIDESTFYGKPSPKYVRTEPLLAGEVIGGDIPGDGSIAAYLGDTLEMELRARFRMEIAE